VTGVRADTLFMGRNYSLTREGRRQRSREEEKREIATEKLLFEQQQKWQLLQLHA